MKWVLSVLILLGAVGYGVRLILSSGLSHIEQAAGLQKSAEKRLEILRSISTNEITETAVEIPRGSVPAETAFTPEASGTTYTLQEGDLFSTVVLKLGAPITKETVGDMEILKYKSCNIVVGNNRVIGWNVK